MEQTILSAADLNLSRVAKSWAVFTTLGTFVGVFLLLGYVSHKADLKDKSVKPTESMLDKAAWTLQSRRARNNPSVPAVVSKPKRKRAVKEYSELQEIEKVLPNVLQSKSLMVKFVNEMKRFHRWFQIVFHYSPYFPRILRLTTIFTTIVLQLFIQAVTYKISNPDTGQCEPLQTEASCVQPRSPLSSSESMCYWTSTGVGQVSCHFKEPGDTLQIVLFVAVFSALASTPMAILTDWVVHNVLAAKTIPWQGNAVSSWDVVGGSSNAGGMVRALRRRMSLQEGQQKRIGAVEVLTESLNDGVIE